MKKIGEGRTAEVFRTSDGQAVKLYYPHYSLVAATAEREKAVQVARVYQKAPRVGELSRLRDRISLFMELIRGVPLNTLIHRSDIRNTGLSLGLMQRDLHIRPSEGLPRAGGIYQPAIQDFPGISSRLRQAMLKYLQSRRDDRLCHGDFHPGNVLQTNKEWRLIDWSTAFAGDPLADIALTLEAIHCERRAGKRFAWFEANRRRRLAGWYLTGYFGKETVPMEDIRRWQVLNRVLAFERRRRGRAGFVTRVESFRLSLRVGTVFRD